ncbi:DNA polymerase III subunit beta [Candidatus Parcubacteria bacterium]|nr:MAG: DNA polymerase III subunit beta [Candidatus Parcubacteria bacterium]
MRVDFLTENINKSLPLIGKILPVHSQVPVLSNILLEANKTSLTLYATDLELGVKINIPAKIETEGTVTVPGKEFIDIINSLPKDRASLVEENGSLVLSLRDNRMVFQTISKDEFPNLFEKKGEKVHSFTQKEFREIFSKIVFSVSLDETKPVLSGVLVYQKEDGVDFVATDGYRMSRVKIKAQKILETGSSFIISGRLVNEALSLKEEDKEKTLDLYIYKEGNQALFETQNIVLVGRLIEGDYPNYERVIPESNKTVVTLGKEDFLQAIKIASVFARESANIVKLKIEDGKLTIFSKSSGVGEGKASVDVKQDGEDNEISFNVKFLIDFLRNTEGKEVIMEVNSPTEPAIFRTPDQKEYIHVVMPVRIQE